MTVLFTTTCEACDGTGRTPPNHRVTCQPCLGTGQVTRLPKPTSERFDWGAVVVTLLVSAACILAWWSSQR